MKYIQTKKLVLFLFLIVSTSNLFGQELPKIIAPTPEAASLGKYGNTPVSKYTGVPNISIPLYTITEGDITVPITLNYHAGGFRVQEEATWVGLGWSLSAGGGISRDTRGNPDLLEPNASEFESWGKNENNVLPASAFNLFNISENTPYNIFGISRVFKDTNQHQHLFDMANYFKKQGSIAYYASGDYQADHFQYSYPGGSGEFYNQDDQHFISKTKNLLKIEKGNSSEHCEFKITDDNGFVYKYGDVSTNGIEKSYGETIHEGTYSSNGNYTAMNYKLSNITSKNGNEVNFRYENTIHSTDYILSTVSVKHAKRYILEHLESFEGISNGSLTESRSRTLNTVLSKIEFTHGYVNFIVNESSDPRLDIAGSGAKKLEIIEVYKYIDNNGNSELVKRIEFEYSYFIASPSIKYTPQFFDFDEEANSKRLRLDRIKEYGSDLNSDPKVHEFYYNSTQLPHKTSYSVDRYGYYNGARNLTYLPSQTLFGITYSGANVDPNPGYVTAGLLEKIVYPTKGSTNFMYEQNEFKVDYVTKKDTIRNSSIFINESQINDVSNANGSFTIDHRQSVHILINLIAVNTKRGPSDLNVRLFAVDNSFSQQWDFAIPGIETNCNPVGSNNCSTDFKLSTMLNPGTYHIETHNTTDVINSSQTTFKSIASSIIEYSSRDYNDTSENGPGVRIKEIINEDSNNDVISHKRFEYLEGNNEVSSSGLLLHKPVYAFFTYDVIDAADPNGGIPEYRTRVYFYRTNKPKETFSSSANGKMLGYNEVTKYNVDQQNLNNGKIVSTYYNHIDDNGLEGTKHGHLNFPNLSSPLNGLLKKEKHYRFTGSDYKLVNKKENNYSIAQASDVRWYGVVVPHFSIVGFNLPIIVGPTRFPICLYPEISTFVQLDNSTETIYDANDDSEAVTITKHFGYENTQLRSEETHNSNGERKLTYYYYPLSTYYQPISNTKPSWMVVPQTMINKNIVSPVIASTVTDNYGNLISTTATDYKVWNGGIVLPEKIKTAKGAISGNSSLKDRIVFHDVDSKGNPLEVSKADGSHIYYVWGYKQKYPIAKIENSPINGFTSMQQNYIDTAITISNNENTLTTENNLRTTLKDLRESFSNSMVTTFTYDPLIGVTSVTDPRGYTSYYEYDEFNRLKFVRDQDGKLVSENKYHYKD